MNVEDIVDRFKNYNPIIHKNDNYYIIEIKNKRGDSLYINLEDEIIISYGNWHCHYESDDDMVIEKVNNILNNRDCVLDIYLDNNYIGSGSELGKDKYTEDDVREFINSFLSNNLDNKECGVKINYWDIDKNYEINFKVRKEV